jgi:hypothetical protein
VNDPSTQPVLDSIAFPAIGKVEVEFYVEPRVDVAAGDTLTLTLLVRNASLRPMRGLAVAAPIPYGAVALGGWCYQDAVRVPERAFYGEGTDLGVLAPGARTAFMWKLRVLEGEEPIRVVPQIWGAVTPITGASPIEVTRLTTAGSTA